MLRETNIYTCCILMFIACNYASQSLQCVLFYLLELWCLFYVDVSAWLSGHTKRLHITLSIFLWQWVFTYTLLSRLCMKSRMLLESIASGAETSVWSYCSENSRVFTLNHLLFAADRITRKEAWICCSPDILYYFTSDSTEFNSSRWTLEVCSWKRPQPSVCCAEGSRDCVA